MLGRRCFIGDLARSNESNCPKNHKNIPLGILFGRADPLSLIETIARHPNPGRMDGGRQSRKGGSRVGDLANFVFCQPVFIEEVRYCNFGGA